MTTRYVWEGGQLENIHESTAQIVGETLANLEKRYGKLKPELVVDAAQSPASPLHRFFQWDDSVAAREYRIQQARGLIRSVHVKIIDDEEIRKPVRAFISMDRYTGNSGYENVVSVMSDDAKREQVLRVARAELEAWRKRYDDLEEFSLLHKFIDEVVVPAPQPKQRKSRRQSTTAG